MYSLAKMKESGYQQHSIVKKLKYFTCAEQG